MLFLKSLGFVLGLFSLAALSEESCFFCGSEIPQVYRLASYEAAGYYMAPGRRPLQSNIGLYLSLNVSDALLIELESSSEGEGYFIKAYEPLDLRLEKSSLEEEEESAPPQELPSPVQLVFDVYFHQIEAGRPVILYQKFQKESRNQLFKISTPKGPVIPPNDDDEELVVIEPIDSEPNNRLYLGLQDRISNYLRLVTGADDSGASLKYFKLERVFPHSVQREYVTERNRTHGGMNK